MTQQQSPIAANQALFKLEYPQSLGVFDTYADAQKAVDFLADQHFPVANIAIVGTDLKLMERVTGRRTWGTVLGQGVMSGLSTGFIVAIFMMILFPTQSFLSLLLTALLIGVGVGLLFSVLGYLVSRGQRDFTSITQTVATRYEILCEHKVAGQARELLAKAPGVRAAQFAPGAFQGYPNPPQPGYGQAPYPGQPGAWGAPPQNPGYAPAPGYGYQPYPGGYAAPQPPTALGSAGPQQGPATPGGAVTPPATEPGQQPDAGTDGAAPHRTTEG